MLNFGPRRVREAAEVNAISPDVEQGPLEAGTLQRSNTFNDAMESNVRFMQDIMTRYDTDGDGFLSKAETKGLMADLKGGTPTEAEVSENSSLEKCSSLLTSCCSLSLQGVDGLCEL
jgi:hypothetical protein